MGIGKSGNGVWNCRNVVGNGGMNEAVVRYRVRKMMKLCVGTMKWCWEIG